MTSDLCSAPHPKALVLPARWAGQCVQAWQQVRLGLWPPPKGAGLGSALGALPDAVNSSVTFISISLQFKASVREPIRGAVVFCVVFVIQFCYNKGKSPSQKCLSHQPHVFYDTKTSDINHNSSVSDRLSRCVDGHSLAESAVQPLS